MDLQNKDAPAQEEETARPEEASLTEGPASPEAERPAGKTGRRGGILAGAVLLVLAGLAAAWIFLSSAPPALTDEAALDQLPAGAEILSRHEQSSGRVQVLEYTCVEEHPFCAVELTQRQPFRYAGGTWTAEGEPETTGEKEDWSALAGLWTEQAVGPGARYVRLRAERFDGQTLTGSIFYIDRSGALREDTAALFGPAEPVGAGAYVLWGSGSFRYNYLHLDRDLGVCFDNDFTPMELDDGTGTAPDMTGGRHRVEPTPTPAPTEAPAEAPAA